MEGAQETGQSTFEFPSPAEEHRWLSRLVGEWSYATRPGDAPDQESREVEGREVVRPVGELWVLAEGEGDMPGSDHTATSLMTIGFEPSSGRFVGTWLGSMMTHLWIYDGFLDETGHTLTLEAEGPSMAGDGSMALYRDVIEIVSDDHRLLRGLVQESNGEWRQFMVVDYRRLK